MDDFDRRIVIALANDGRLTAVELADRIGLAPSTITRRLQALEKSGIIRGYRAIVDAAKVALSVNVFVEITLERQDDEHLRAFETAVRDCPSVLSCYLMSGASDYLLHVVTRDLEDFESVHARVLSHLPGVARIESKFGLRSVVDRPLTPM